MTAAPTLDQAPGIYADTRAEMISVARDLTTEQAATEVIMCPGWTIKDVYAHVVGINDDFLAGRLDGLGTDAWTAAQVERRAADSLDAVCDEWERLQPLVDAVTHDDHFTAMRLTADLAAHRLDILSTLGRTDGRDGRATRMALVRYCSAVMERVTEAGLPTLELVADDLRWTSSTGEVAVSLPASPFELFRVLTGRRSAAQTSALPWTGDPAPYLHLLSPYGAATSDLHE